MADVLKEKEEVQEFLKNLGIEYRYSCYSEKNPEGCQLLGDYLAQIDVDYEKANKVFKDNCDARSHGRSCSSYALNLLYGRGSVKDVPEALKYFSRACDIDDPTGCDFAGKLLVGFEAQQSKNITEDPQKGLAYLEKGCRLANTSHLFEMSESCYAAAFMQASGFKLAARDMSRAIDLATRSCDLGKLEGCRLAAELYTKIGDAKKAEELHKRFQIMKKQTEDTTALEMQRT